MNKSDHSFESKEIVIHVLKVLYLHNYWFRVYRGESIEESTSTHEMINSVSLNGSVKT